ncbi:hypothetical protein M9Y10_011083 [Tritrichomonas musculus]|uniref:MBL fold metallo-hydrolase n=1 Tax=Tritrichomonas musculus TaxID=1915356 RepID=A0ABR2IMN8_9EUKA
MTQFSTPLGEIKVTPLFHATVLIEFNGKYIYVDPALAYATPNFDASKSPKADLICITHDHHDHLDLDFIQNIRKPDTFIVSSKTCAEKLNNINKTLSPGESAEWQNIKIEAVYAYNIEHLRSPGNPFHPKGYGNGYIFNFGTFRLYVPGDTEVIPEMKNFGHIDVAFLPLMLPYTMDENMVVAAAKDINPKTLFIYHYRGDINRAAIQEKLPGVQVL